MAREGVAALAATAAVLLCVAAIGRGSSQNSVQLVDVAVSSSALFSLAVGSAASSAAGNLPSARPPLRPPLRPSEDGNGLPPLASLSPPRNL
ncbi:MAG: hypothetical protein ACPIOQ_57935, partial [Promethearchaeia archaeon]